MAAISRSPSKPPLSETPVPPARSALMRAVRRRDTGPELTVRRALHARGWRFRLHRKDLPGSPDIVFPSRRKVIFVHGCFWHGHDCPKGRQPKTRQEFWATKIHDNRARDHRAEEALSGLGWSTLVVWQCELREREAVLQRVEAFLGSRTKPRDRMMELEDE